MRSISPKAIILGLCCLPAISMAADDLDVTIRVIDRQQARLEGFSHRIELPARELPATATPVRAEQRGPATEARAPGRDAAPAPDRREIKERSDAERRQIAEQKEAARETTREAMMEARDRTRELNETRQLRDRVLAFDRQVRR